MSLEYMVKKILSKTQKKQKKSPEAKFCVNFRPVNMHLISTISQKLICSKFPCWLLMKIEIGTQ